MRADLAVACANHHGEGIIWSSEHRLVMWTDIHGERLWRHDPAAGMAFEHSVPGRLCCFATRQDKPWNEVVAAFADGFAFLDILSGVRQNLAAFEPELPTTRLNDGRTDPRGRLIAGGMDEAEEARGISSVWRLDADLGLVRLFGGVACANSVCFSPDGRTLYFADSAQRNIRAYDYDIDSGTVGAGRLFADVDGVPDGSCVDADGCLWNAVWQGYRVDRWSPDGRLIASIALPVAKPTCCVFGGDDLGTLFITTSQLAETPERLQQEPLAGSLFAVRPGVAGLPCTPFAG